MANMQRIVVSWQSNILNSARRIGNFIPFRASRARWIVALVVSSFVLDLLYFRGLNSTRSLSYSDLTPWPDLSPSILVAVLGAQWVSVSYPGQFVVGTGFHNLLSPSMVFQASVTWTLGGGGLAEAVFYVLLPPLSSLGFYLFSGVLTSRGVVRFGSGIMYGFNPFILTILYGGGNPPGIWWYFLIPYLLWASIFYLRSGSKWHMIALSVSLILSSIVSPEYLPLTVLFFFGPILIYVYALLPLVDRTKLVKWCVLAAASIVVLDLLPYSALIGVLYNSSISGASVSYSAIQSSFPSIGQLFLYDIPTFGLTLNSSYLAQVQSLGYVTGLGVAIDAMLFTPFLLSRNSNGPNFRYIPGVCGLWSLVVWLSVQSGMASPIYNNFAPAFVLDSPVKVFPAVIVATVGGFSVTMDWLMGRISELLSARPIRRLLGTRPEPCWPPHPKHCIRTESLVVAVIASLLVVGPILPAYEQGRSTFLDGVSNLQVQTYVPAWVSSGAQAVQHVRELDGLMSSRSLWMPVNGGAAIESSITYSDPSALFFPTVGADTLKGTGGFVESYLYYQYVLSAIAGNQTTSAGRLLANLGISVVVLVTQPSPPNRGFVSRYGPVYDGPPAFSSGVIIGNPKDLEAILDSQTDLKPVASFAGGTVYLNEATFGIAGYARATLESSNSSILSPTDSSMRVLSSIPLGNASGPLLATLTGPTDNAVTQGAGSFRVLGLSGAAVAPIGNIVVYDSNEVAADCGCGMVEENGSPSGSVAQFSSSVRNIAAPNYNGTLVGSLNFTGSTLNFNNKTYVALSTNATASLLNLTKYGFTLSAWIYSDPTHGEYQTVFSQGSAYWINTNGPYLQMNVHTSSSGGSFDVRYAPRVWYFIAITYNGSSFEAYVNGSLIGTQNVSGPVSSWASPFFIGNDGTYTDRNWSGRIANLRLFRHALNLTDIGLLDSSGPNGSSSLDSSALVYFPLTSSDFVTSTVNIDTAGQGFVGILGKGNFTLSTPSGNLSFGSQERNETWRIEALRSNDSSVALSSQAGTVSAIVVIQTNLTFAALSSELTVNKLTAKWVSPDSAFISGPIPASWLIFLQTFDSGWGIQGGTTAVLHFGGPGDNVFLIHSAGPTGLYIVMMDKVVSPVESWTVGVVILAITTALFCSNIPTLRKIRAIRHRRDGVHLFPRF